MQRSRGFIANKYFDSLGGRSAIVASGPTDIGRAAALSWRAHRDRAARDCNTSAEIAESLRIGSFEIRLLADGIDRDPILCVRILNRKRTGADSPTDSKRL